MFHQYANFLNNLNDLNNLNNPTHKKTKIDYDNDHDIQRGPSETKIDYDDDHDIQRAPSESNPRDLWPETWHLRHW